MKDKVKEYFRKNSLKIFLIIVIVLFFVYIFCNDFRSYLLSNSIDPSFVVGFLTAIALILSIIQSLSDRRFSYNTNLVNSLEDKGIKVIAKLLAIRQKSEVLSITIKEIKKAIDNDVRYIDSNNTLSKENIEKEMEMATAYVQTYFSEEGTAWNDLQNKLSALSTNCVKVLLNYEKNIEVLKDPDFSNSTLNNIDQTITNIDQTITNSENIYNDIDKSAEEMSARIVKKMNEYKGKLKDNFYFNL